MKFLSSRLLVRVAAHVFPVMVCLMPLKAGTPSKDTYWTSVEGVTIYARHGHVFMSVCGLRLDTGGHGGRGESGPRWCANSRAAGGFVMRHPLGF